MRWTVDETAFGRRPLLILAGGVDLNSNADTEYWDDPSASPTFMPAAFHVSGSDNSESNLNDGTGRTHVVVVFAWTGPL